MNNSRRAGKVPFSSVFRGLPGGFFLENGPKS